MYDSNKNIRVKVLQETITKKQEKSHLLKYVLLRDGFLEKLKNLIGSPLNSLTIYYRIDSYISPVETNLFVQTVMGCIMNFTLFVSISA
uniref:Uncharacterized protein n=1 Tax=Onchocerca volvulus TaxID=6282 RepID=A0A8R1TVE0_ONCVO